MNIRYEQIKKFAPLAVIALIAGLSGYMVYNYMKHNSDQLEREYAERDQKNLLEVVVAATDMPRGTIASSGNMAIRRIPRTYLPAGYVTPSTADTYFGRKLVVDMHAGTPLSAAFIESEVFTPFSRHIDVGLRALTIPVDEINSISGLLRAGDHLDLYMTASSPFGKESDGRDNQVVIPLLQNLVVNATGQLTKEETDNRNKLMADNSNISHDRYTTITVAVSQKDAQRLIIAQQVGKITAVLRNAGDKGGTADVVTTRSLFASALNVPDNGTNLSVLYLVGGSGIKRIQEGYPTGSSPRRTPVQPVR